MMKKGLLAAFSLGVFVFLASCSGADELAVPANAGDKNAGEAGEEVFIYTIVPHDTLWDISEKFLKNPFKWPKLWKLNPYIKNPDLIYPGNIVRITPDGIEIIDKRRIDAEKLPVVSLEPETEKVVMLEPEKVEPPPPPGPAFVSDELPRIGFVSAGDLDSAGVIVGPKEAPKMMMNTGDEVYVSFGKDSGVKAGETFTVFHVGSEIFHPVTGEKLGNMVDILGSLTVKGSDGDILAARIDNSFKEIEEGSRLRLFKAPVKEVKITEAEGDVEGYVVASLEHAEQLSERDVVYIDRGTTDGLRKGNLMRIYRLAEDIADPMSEGKKLSLPPVELGRLIVTEAGEHTSAGIVLESLKPIVWGDRVTTIGVGQISGKNN